MAQGDVRIDRIGPCPYIAAMAVRDILIIPDKRLRLKSEPVKAVDKTLRALINDMFETMYAAPGIGLAAIQIGAPQRVVTMDLAKKTNRSSRKSSSIRKSPGLRTKRQLMRKDAFRFLNITRKSSARSRLGEVPRS